MVGKGELYRVSKCLHQILQEDYFGELFHTAWQQSEGDLKAYRMMLLTPGERLAEFTVLRKSGIRNTANLMKIICIAKPCGTSESLGFSSHELHISIRLHSTFYSIRMMKTKERNISCVYKMSQCIYCRARYLNVSKCQTHNLLTPEEHLFQPGSVKLLDSKLFG